MFKKIVPYVQAVVGDLLKVWWSIRLWTLQTYYRVKLGVPVKDFPPEVLRKLYFNRKMTTEDINGILAPSVVIRLSKAHGVITNETQMFLCLAAMMQGRYELQEAIGIAVKVITGPTEGLRRRIYDQMVKFQDINPRQLVFTNRELSEEVECWLDNDDTALSDIEVP